MANTLRVIALDKAQTYKAAKVVGIAPCHSDRDLAESAAQSWGETLDSVFGYTVNRRTEWADAVVTLWTD